MDQTATEQYLAERYGTHRPRRRIALLVLLVVVAGAALVWVVWTAVLHANPAIDAAVSAFDVKGPHRIDATVQLRVRDSSVDGSCLLRASAVDHSVVGELTFRVKDVANRREQTYRVRTEREATTVELVSCTGSH